MRTIRWRWLLSSALLSLTLVGYVFSVHHRQVGFGPADDLPHWPPPLERISDCVNFPALVLAYPLHQAGTVYGYLTDWGFIWVTAEDLGIFAGVVLFWYLVGAAMDRHFGHYSGVQLNRTARVATFVGGIGFGGLTAVYADYLLGDYFEGPRQIGACGLVWASILFIWFVRRLMRETGAARHIRRATWVMTVVLLLAAVLWIGGPFGATQALGEYLRPTQMRAVEPPESMRCSPDERPPTAVMRYIESQMALHHLTLQKLAVCKTAPFFDMGAPGQIDCAEEYLSIKRGRWLKIGCGASQFRRHFDVSLGTFDGRQTREVQAILIQSRWDYLKSSWNLTRGFWFWPYEGYMQSRREWTIIKDWMPNGGL